MKIKINSYIPITDVEGPGTRFAVWVQGCSLRCPGCANRHMWDFDGGTEYDTDEIINLIKRYKDKIEGVTFLGGEPLEQTSAVTEIAKAVQETGLSVFVFTGYEYEDIKDNADFIELAKYTDLLADGKFEPDKIDYTRPWIGSSNQNYRFLSSRYNEETIKKHKNKIEIRITPDNKVTINGMGDTKKLGIL